MAKTDPIHVSLHLLLYTLSSLTLSPGLDYKLKDISYNGKVIKLQLWYVRALHHNSARHICIIIHI